MPTDPCESLAMDGSPEWRLPASLDRFARASIRNEEYTGAFRFLPKTHPILPRIREVATPPGVAEVAFYWSRTHSAGMDRPPGVGASGMLGCWCVSQAGLRSTGMLVVQGHSIDRGRPHVRRRADAEALNRLDGEIEALQRRRERLNIR